MIILTVIIFALLLLLGCAALIYAIRQAPEGYEDEQGFHTVVSRHTGNLVASKQAGREDVTQVHRHKLPAIFGTF